MDDLAPSAIPPTAKWEETPSDDGRGGQRHRRAPEKRSPEEIAAVEEAEPHDLDELA
jgi:hypothetical protein